MGGITFNMTGVENTQKQVTMEWFSAFNKSFGVSSEETLGWQLLEDISPKTSEEQGKASPKSEWIRGLLARFRKPKTEFLGSQKEAEEVISCCLRVLEVIYGIHISTPYSIKLCYSCDDGTAVKFENIPGFGSTGKTRKKRREKNKNVGTIYILYNAPYLLVVKDFLTKCFDANIGKLKAYKNMEVAEVMKLPEIMENPDGKETEEEQAKEEKVPEKEKKAHMIAWLVANCLYVMGELEYAEEYIEDYQKAVKNEGFVEICKKLGIPWAEQAKMLETNE